mmetsp:Transcript_6712/g.14613  ORF Transcript_6712/g.14613 Transcript_6712/m.14613 type:complete len:111 (-) Transcript_6712:13-345(-)
MMTIGWEATRATAVTLIPCINRNSQWPSSFLKRKPRQCLGQLHQRPSVAVSNNHNKGINLNFVGNIGNKDVRSCIGIGQLPSSVRGPELQLIQIFGLFAPMAHGSREKKK